jgi:hypothetical protein
VVTVLPATQAPTMTPTRVIVTLPDTGSGAGGGTNAELVFGLLGIGAVALAAVAGGLRLAGKRAD